ncbi:MAG: Fe-only nitrogenase subunit delta [Helicobacteraceae bacterium]|jgi:nitrogenase delta subunit|nr:Fe-only nitrogenase subunit delta [Helicobacteraceae bacterium]
MSATLPKSRNRGERKYKRVYESDPLIGVDPDTREKVGQLENYIMKNCLWQFNSRGWDRRRQNAGVLGKTAQLLCGESVDNPTPLDKCHWVDAVCLDRAYRALFPWITTMDKDDVKALMKILHARLDWLTIDGSLNQELTIINY